MSANMFEYLASKIRNSSLVIWVFFASLAMLVIGINHFVEDTLSSMYGFKLLEENLGIIPASYGFTYFTMSLSAQVAQIVFGYMLITDRKKYGWAWWVILIAFAADFMSDIYYRSNQGSVSAAGYFATFLLTFMFFTFGSEVFITMGIGLVLELLGPFIVQSKRFLRSIRHAWKLSPTASYIPPPANMERPPEPPRVATFTAQPIKGPIVSGRPVIPPKPIQMKDED